MPAADPSIVRHLLYLDGYGRPTPYLSTSELEEIAQRFAGKDGRVWYSLVQTIEALKLRYISNTELLSLLRGKGKGDAAWPKASEVQTARAFAEENAEHLVDFRNLNGVADEEMVACVQALFKLERP